MLRASARREGIEAPEAALHLIARAGAGSYRDALTTLDQIATARRGPIAAGRGAPARRRPRAGARSTRRPRRAAATPGELLGRIDALAESRQDMDGLVDSLLEHLRLLYLLQHAETLPESEAAAPDRIAELAAPGRSRSRPRRRCARSTCWPTALRDIRDGTDARLPLEVALLKAARPAAQRCARRAAGARRAARARARRRSGPAPPPRPRSGRAAAPPPPPRRRRAPRRAAARPRRRIRRAGGTGGARAGSGRRRGPGRGACAARRQRRPPAELAAVAAGWDEALGQLTGPARGVLSASRPTAVEGSSVVVEVSAPLLSSSQRYGEQLAEAIATALALRLEPRFVAVAQAAAAAPTDGDGTISEVELLDQLRRRLDATEEAG